MYTISNNNYYISGPIKISLQDFKELRNTAIRTRKDKMQRYLAAVKLIQNYEYQIDSAKALLKKNKLELQSIESNDNIDSTVNDNTYKSVEKKLAQQMCLAVAHLNNAKDNLNGTYKEIADILKPEFLTARAREQALYRVVEYVEKLVSDKTNNLKKDTADITFTHKLDEYTNVCSYTVKFNDCEKSFSYKIKH